MRHHRKVFLAAFVLAQAWTAIPSVAAFQRFTDEAGVVIYTIDDDGIVSMFESRPGTDITISVTRGTREKMQPRISEVTPDAIPAGTSTVLKLKGENLVGANVKFNVRTHEVFPFQLEHRGRACGDRVRRHLGDPGLHLLAGPARHRDGDIRAGPAFEHGDDAVVVDRVDDHPGFIGETLKGGH